MCTLSWIRDPTGFEIHFNRDERHTRAGARPPEQLESSGLRLLAPRDGDFGGTWIGVNERGVAIALLNGWHLQCPERDDFRSRGLLVLDALGRGSLDELREWLRSGNLERYRAFTLCAFGLADERDLRAEWDGAALTLGVLEEGARPLVSSSYRYEDVVQRRRALFLDIAGARPGGRQLARFHATHRPEKGPFSTCMHRNDASTKSYTTIRVEEGEARLAYFDSAPCESGTLHEKALALRGAGAT